MAGADFVRADLHVHTTPDDATPSRPVEEFIQAAIDRGIRVLGITDHNSVSAVRRAIEAARGLDLLILPGIEVTTHEGHLLGLFAPEQVEALEEFATAGSLRLVTDARDGSRRSERSLVDLVGDIDARGGLAIPAHVDARDGMVESIGAKALASLLASPGLAAIEFGRVDALRQWFTPTDDDGPRRNAWLAREAVPGLRDRGLARVMSSDAHSPDKVGQDRSARTLTRLRMDDLNFTAVRNALMFSPRARCKVEVNLPPSYPRVRRATFEGGFLDGVDIEFSPNLNCLIGGRGSGKSTALLAIRAALGDAIDPADGDDPDDPERMPERTVVEFIDAFGTERTAIRARGGYPYEEEEDIPITLDLQGLGQDESGRLARGYRADPAALLRFLEQFVDVAQHDTREQQLLNLLADNGAEVKSTSTGLDKIPELERKLKELDAQLTAAEKSRVEDLARWAALLASEVPFLSRLRETIDAVVADRPRTAVDIDALARDAGVNLQDKRAAGFTEGAAGLRAQIANLERQRSAAGGAWSTAVSGAATPARSTLDRWAADHAELQRRLDAKQKELEALGLKVQAGAVRAVATEIERLRKEVGGLKERKLQHRAVLKTRQTLLQQLRANRDARFERRKAALKHVLDEANTAAGGLTIHLRHERSGIRDLWEQWLGRYFKFRSPRVERVARTLSPAAMADGVVEGGAGLRSVQLDGEYFFDQPGLIEECVPAVRTWDGIFELQTMHLEDRVRMEVHEPGGLANREFDQLSAGQQRSVLLSLILCAHGSDPLVLDQPEDHLDAPYIASALVGHLEAAKERRQVILATHSANLTVLGDAELVVPLYADAGHGAPLDPGAVDRPETRERVCALLEGGTEAFRRRGLRYGYRFR